MGMWSSQVGQLHLCATWRGDPESPCFRRSWHASVVKLSLMFIVVLPVWETKCATSTDGFSSWGHYQGLSAEAGQQAEMLLHDAMAAAAWGVPFRDKLHHWLHCRKESGICQFEVEASLLKVSKKIYFYVYGGFDCMDVCVSHACMVPVEARRGCWLPWNYGYRQLWAIMYARNCT